MKAGMPLALMCFVISKRGLLNYRFMRDRVEKKGGYIFALSDLERCVAEAGFDDFRPQLHGAILVLRLS